MYKHIFWDFDGTLFNTYPAMVGALQKALAQHGHAVHADDILAQMKITLSYALRYFADRFSIDLDTLRTLTDEFRAQDEPLLCAPYDGIATLCRTIAQSGRKNYLYTHRNHTAIDLIRRFDMEQDFEDFITQEHGFERKPSPQALQHMMQKHKIPADQAVMIGDRALDVQSGKSAGMHGCFFALDGGEPGGQPDHVVYTITQLYQMIGLPAPDQQGR